MSEENMKTFEQFKIEIDNQIKHVNLMLETNEIVGIETYENEIFGCDDVLNNSDEELDCYYEVRDYQHACCLEAAEKRKNYVKKLATYLTKILQILEEDEVFSYDDLNRIISPDARFNLEQDMLNREGKFDATRWLSGYLWSYIE